MSRTPSLLDKLDALEAMADAKLPPPPPPPPEPRRETVAAAPMPDQGDIYAMLSELKRDIAALHSEQQQQRLPEPGAVSRSAQEQYLYGLLNELRRDVEVLRREQATQTLPPGERQLYAMLAELRADIRALEETREDGGATRSRLPARWSGPPPPAARGASRFGNIPAVWLVALVPLALLAGTYATTIEQGIGRLLPGSSAVGSAPRALPLVGAQTPLFEALSAGSTSPRGVDALGVSDMRALSRASSILADPSRDSEEAAFWLKRYLSATLADRNVARALTQLGSAQADATGKAPDYVKARHLWEMASAAGDPVAMCFLGKLFEAGTGVAANKRAALNWFERAKRSGGCADADDAIARLR